MSEGTNVGSIHMDLIIRDTIEKQIQNIAAKGQSVANKAFSNVWQSTEKNANKATASIAKTTQKMAASIEDASNRLGTSLGNSFTKPVAMAQAQVKKLEREYERISSKLSDVSWSYSYNENGDKATDKMAERLAAQREAAYDRLISARERMAIEEQATAEKQAATESAAAQKAADAEEKAANRRKAIHASMWKNMLSRAGDGAKSMVSKLSGITKGYNRSGSAARRFGSRLREIASGALIFNGISMAMRNMVSYFSESIASADQMKEALANLKGAAANAASPIIQVLTPALTALANAAATALSYVSRLVTMLTGKISNAAATAAKSAQTAAGAAKKASRSLASFDQIERLGGDSSGGGGGGSEETAPNYDFEGKSHFLESILSSIQAGQWGQVGGLIAEKLSSSLAAIQWPSIQEKAQQWTQNLVDTLNGLGTNLNWELLGHGIGNGLNTILVAIDTFFQGIKWEELGKNLGTGLTKLVDTVNWTNHGKVLSDKFKALFETFHGFLQTFDFSKLGSSLAEMLNAAFENINWQQLTADIGKLISGLAEASDSFMMGASEKLQRVVMTGLGLSFAKSGIGKMFLYGLGKTLIKAITVFDDWAQASVVPKIASVFSSLGSWITGTLVPTISAGLTAIASTLGISVGWLVAIGAAVAALVAVVVANWDKIVSWTKKAWGNIVKVWKAAPEWFSRNIVKPVTNLFSDLWDEITKIWKGVPAWFDTNVIRPVTEFFSDLWDKVSQLCKDAWEKIQQIWQKVASWFDTNVIRPVSNFFSGLWEDVSGFCADCWAGMQETWKSVSDWFKTNVVKPITDAFQSVYDSVSDIWNNLVAFIKGAINGIIGAINGMLSGLVTGINSVIRMLNKLSFTIPDWVDEKYAGKTFGFSIQEVVAPQIPYLANGGVIQQPTLAMMGEYAGARSNPEIVTPQSLMAETVAGVMEDVVASVIAGFERVVEEQQLTRQAVEGIEIGDEIIGQATARYNRKMAVVRGGY